MIKIPEHVQNLVPYKAGKPVSELLREKNIQKVVKLASNENPLGTSPKVIQAIKDEMDQFNFHVYTDPKCYELIKKVSGYFNVSENRIIPGAGSDTLIQYVLMTFTNEGDEVLTSEGTFIGWYVNVNKLNRKQKLVPLKNYAYNLDAILEAVDNNTKIVYLANPNNPTGTMFNSDEFEKFMDNLPKNVLVVLDEAYTLFAGYYPGYPDGLSYNYPNLIVLRTFSKDFGMASLRLGFAFGEPELISAMFKVKMPFEPTYLAQKGGMAAVEDLDFLLKTLEVNNTSLNRLKKTFDSLGLQYTNSVANFYLLIFENEETAVKFDEMCLERGLILRHVKSFGIPNGVRINSGTEEETDFAISVISEVYEIIKEKETILN
ncbi:MAG: histidinol-phosphate transaminase [Ignavibacteriaceae bacterium]|nr:histidinol-phosphate transaminase [Ignavibacteriaceae bacterium]